MITYDRKANIGFDLDFDLEINDYDENYTPAEHIIKKAIDQIALKYGYKTCEEFARGLRIKR